MGGKLWSVEPRKKQNVQWNWKTNLKLKRWKGSHAIKVEIVGVGSDIERKKNFSFVNYVLAVSYIYYRNNLSKGNK